MQWFWCDNVFGEPFMVYRLRTTPVYACMAMDATFWEINEMPIQEREGERSLAWLPRVGSSEAVK